MKAVIGMVAAAIAVAAGAPGTARAEIENVQFNSNPAGLCQSSTPAFESNLRKRPLAIKNEGSGNAFITCSFTTLMSQSGNGTIETSDVVSHFGAFFANSTSVDQTASCTAVIGYENAGDVQYVAKEFLVEAGNVPADEVNGHGYVFFYPEDADLERFHQLASMSCRLPPGVSINDTYVGQWLDDDTGAIP